MCDICVSEYLMSLYTNCLCIDFSVSGFHRDLS